ncbi:MAG: NAD(P)/FAD-dependent oxidoreductase [Oscillospiraceae bacterium]
MTIIIPGIRLPLCEGVEIEPRAVRSALRMTGVQESALESVRLRRVSYDARHGSVNIICSLALDISDNRDCDAVFASYPLAKVWEKSEVSPSFGDEEATCRPIVAGFGPAGMFASLLLARHGYRPLVIEKGPSLDERVRSVESFFAGGPLDTHANVQFGEGGAGAFSDGKLTTRINDPLCDYVLETLVSFGAPEDILWKAKPHVGTDRLRGVVSSLRREVERLGGEFKFGCPLDDIEVRDGAVVGINLGGGSLNAQAVVLACGHSARETFAMLARRGATLSAKPFSVGMRIEHPQELIDRAAFGRLAEDPRVPRGEYALSVRARGRAVYTFCMCPGGEVVAASSEEGAVVVNGMSEYARAGSNANSAVVCAVGPQDYANDPFAAIEYQRTLERAAFAAAGGAYRAPAQDVKGFTSGKASLETSLVQPSYRRGINVYNMRSIFGEDISSALAEGIGLMGKKLHGFDDARAVLTGVETRTSSPVRIERGISREATGIAGLYPCGEGAGYAGGIMSAAVDGMKTAIAIMEKYRSF